MNPWFIYSVLSFLSVAEEIKASFREKEDVTGASVTRVTPWSWSDCGLGLEKPAFAIKMPGREHTLEGP